MFKDGVKHVGVNPWKQVYIKYIYMRLYFDLFYDV